MKIFIATPVLNYTCSINYTSSLIKTIDLLKKCDISYELNYVNNLITPLSRDILTDLFMKSDCTHLFFIDSDISWNEYDFIKIINNCEDVHSGCYPFKTYYFDKYDKEKSYSNDNIESKLLNYVALKTDTNDPNNKENILDVINVGTGFMCINKDVLINLHDKCKKYKYENKELINYFALTYNDNYLPEDFNFCKMVRENNMKLTVDITVNLTHEGVNLFKGNVIKSSLEI